MPSISPAVGAQSTSSPPPRRSILNVFVGVVQAFEKLPFLRPLAPTQSEPPFVVAQLVVLLAFIALGAIALARFHPKTRATA
jgi:hypothetical protein